MADFLRSFKGQLISERYFGVFKSFKKPAKFWTDFCPMKLGQKSVKNLVDFLGDLKTPKFYSEINLPLNEWVAEGVASDPHDFTVCLLSSKGRTHLKKAA